MPRGQITSSKVPAGQYLPRAQGKPGPDEPVACTYAHNVEKKLEPLKTSSLWVILSHMEVDA